MILLLLAVLSQDAPDLSTVPADLTTPPMKAGEPAAGRRVKQTTPGWESTGVHHALFLPRDWSPERRLPVIVEYAGNGGYRNAFGDVSHGTVEGSNLGFGLSGGEGFVWVCLPFVKKTREQMEKSVDGIRAYLNGSGVTGSFTFQAIPFRNHSDQWVLRDIPERKAVREWLRKAIAD